jgi:hypothetical protein
MTELSPSAQAVLNAFRAVPDLRDCPSIAAAIRAAADQVVPVEPEDKDLDFSNPDDKAEWYQWSQRQCTRHQLLAIAAELEQLND